MQPVLKPRPTDDRPTPISIKVLLALSVMLLVAVLYNAMGGGWQATRGRRSGRVHEAAVPLQKRPRRSKYAHTIDDEPDQFVIAKANGSVALIAKSTAAAYAATVPGGAQLPTGLPVMPKTASAATAAVAAVPPESTPQLFAAHVDKLAALPDAEQLSCHARDGYDIAGDAAYVWGLAFNVGSAAECCQACAAHRRVCGAGGASARGKPFWQASRRERTQARCSGAVGQCNAWVYCAGSEDPSNPAIADRCFSYTIHNHTKGECWLKHEANESYPIAHGPTLPDVMRRAPRADWPWAVNVNVWPWEVPARVSWQAGIVAARSAPVWKGTRLPDWHHKFCNGKHGPC